MSAMIVPKRNLHQTDTSPDAKAFEAVKQWITGNSSIPFSRYYVPAYPGRICRPIAVLEQHRVPIYSLAQQRHLDQTDAHPLGRKKHGMIDDGCHPYQGSSSCSGSQRRQ